MKRSAANYRRAAVRKAITKKKLRPILITRGRIANLPQAKLLLLLLLLLVVGEDDIDDDDETWPMGHRPPPVAVSDCAQSASTWDVFKRAPGGVGGWVGGWGRWTELPIDSLIISAPTE